MNDFQGLLSSDYGFKPQGKAAPMASQKSSTSSLDPSSFNFDIGTAKTSSFPSTANNSSDFSDLGDVFSSKPKNHSSSKVANNVNLDSIFGDSAGGGDLGPKFSSLPVFDKPVYDDEVSSSVKYEDIFSSSGNTGGGDAFDDLLGGIGKKGPQSPRSGGSKVAEKSSIPSFDDLLPGFGSGSGSATSINSSASFRESNPHGHASPSYEENMASSDDIWFIVSEIPLLTQPTPAPPPSRPPPPRPAHFSRAESGSFPAPNVYNTVNDYSSFPGSGSKFQSPKSSFSGVKGSFASPLDELEEFAMGRNPSDEDRNSHVRSSEDLDSNGVAAASAAAMKEAMERAEAKFRYARGVRERENAKASRSRDSMQVEKDEKPMYDAPEREFREHQEWLEREQQQREREEEEKRRREEETRRIEKEREEKEREKRRIERERELARQAVEKAAKEARERAAVEARARAERVSVQRAQAEARERAGRAAIQRAHAEARERAAAGVKERAEKAAAEAREKAKAEAREKEAREREAREKEASERAASAARANQQRNDNDLESFFSMGSRASSAPRPRATSSDPFGTDEFQSKPAPEATSTYVNSSSSMRKASSSTNIVDDLSSIFGGPPSSNDFQEFEGETEERRRVRMERHQRTQERAAKALAEKNARDLEAQREQSERHRIAETLDVEIRRWAAGKEANLRALLSTLQYVLWPECGWQPVSLTDLITGAAVKKAYRKATLCIHPDKVQQKGATLQQKYVAEKVFDLLKEAWNKFNSEELF